MTYLQIWRTKTDWLTWQTLNHHVYHATVTASIAFIAYLLGLDLTVATFIAMGFGLVWEIIGFITGEKIHGCLCDLAQFWMFAPFVLYHHGNWILAIPCMAILIWWYLTTLKAHFERER